MTLVLGGSVGARCRERPFSSSLIHLLLFAFQRDKVAFKQRFMPCANTLPYRPAPTEQFEKMRKKRLTDIDDAKFNDSPGQMNPKDFKKYMVVFFFCFSRSNPSDSFLQERCADLAKSEVPTMTKGQKAALLRDPRFFLKGDGGTGKSYVYNAVYHELVGCGVKVK